MSGSDTDPAHPVESDAEIDRLKRELATAWALNDLLRHALAELDQEMLGSPPSIAYDNDYDSSDLRHRVGAALAEAKRIRALDDKHE